MTRRPRALVVAPVMPEASGSGLAMRIGLFLEALARSAEVDLLVAPVFGPPRAGSQRWAAALCAHVTCLDLHDALDTHFGLLMRIGDSDARSRAFASFGKPQLTAMMSLKTVARAEAALDGRRYDLIHVARSYCAGVAAALASRLAQPSRPFLSIDLDEDDSHLQRQLAGRALRRGDVAAQRWHLIEAAHYQATQASLAGSFNRISVSSALEAQRLSPRVPAVDVVPNAVALPRLSSRSRQSANLLFVGALGYAPNAEAIEWFLARVWPRLGHQSGVRLRIAGAGASQRFKRMCRRPGVELLGWLPDLRNAYATAALVIAPLLSGAGTRIKLLDAAAYGVASVATGLAAEGLEFRNGVHYWRADTDVAFAASIIYALDHPEHRMARAAAARALVVRQYDRAAVVARLAAGFGAALEP